MPNNCLSVLYKHIIQVENKNVGLKVGGGGAQTYHCPPPQSKKWGAHAPIAPPLPTPVNNNNNNNKYNNSPVIQVIGKTMPFINS